MKGLRLIVIPLAIGALLLSTGVSAKEPSKKNPLEPDPIVLNPPASAAPVGNWSYVESRGYLWVPTASAGICEAEWAPWDPWWAMPYGRWTWAAGWGWGWTPAIPPWDMSPLGWGFDSWYGGWYGFTPDGNPSNTMGSYGGSDVGFYVPPGYWKNHDGGVPGRRGGSRTEPSRVKIATVVAAPPKSLAAPLQNSRLDQLEDKQRADQAAGYAQHRDRADRQHGLGQGHGQGRGHGGGRIEPGRGSAPPTGGSGGGISAAPSGHSGQPKRH